MLGSRSDLRIGIIKSSENSDTKTELQEIIDFIDKKNPFVRGKNLIIIMNGENTTHESALRFGWNKKFLDLSIIEYVSADKCEKFDLQSVNESGHRLFMHVYNPFLELYSKMVLTPDTPIFPDKSRNLHGFPLKQYSPEETEFLKAILEMDQTFAEILNLRKTYVYTNEELDTTVHNDLQSEKIDYIIGLHILQYDQLCNWTRCWEASSYLVHLDLGKSANFHAMVYQYTPPEADIPISSAITMEIILIIGAIFSIFARFLKLDAKNCTVPKTVRIILGASGVLQSPSRPSQIIFTMALFAVSGLISIYFNDDMISIVLGQKSFLNIKSFEDLLNSDLKVFMTDSTKYIFLNSTHREILIWKFSLVKIKYLSRIRV
ncbi:hypothetical protein QAD02_010853 [Eretmocerus hayati]|uniref:Uncharacterized protein n=1 Tax=Eretmocerus hayati TaxID=131215 RepID=A0ACC2NVA4_9HYME|nr:hypothetical protein QAD02_010853 [Eretmocerus hayati]